VLQAVRLGSRQVRTSNRVTMDTRVAPERSKRVVRAA
jgi:hypothetical protein